MHDFVLENGFGLELVGRNGSREGSCYFFNVYVIQIRKRQYVCKGSKILVTER